MSLKFLLIFISLCLIQTVFSQTKPLVFHKGPVMDKDISIHLLWYGPWGASDEEVVTIEFVASNIGASQYWQTVTCLEDLQGNPITNHVDNPSSFIESNTKKWGNTINDQASFETILLALVSAANLLLDPNDIYVLITHDDVASTLLCGTSVPSNLLNIVQVCGYHYYFNQSAASIKYMVVGSGGFINTCAPCATNVNGPWGPLTNQLVNTFVHQLVNTVSDPIPYTGWLDSGDNEAATKCMGNYVGSIPFRPNKFRNYNVVLTSGSGTTHWFLIQGTWDITAPNGGACRTYPYTNCQIVAPPTPQVSSAHAPSSASMIQAGLSVLVSTVFAFFFLF